RCGLTARLLALGQVQLHSLHQCLDAAAGDGHGLGREPGQCDPGGDLVREDRAAPDDDNVRVGSEGGPALPRCDRPVEQVDAQAAVGEAVAQGGADLGAAADDDDALDSVQCGHRFQRAEGAVGDAAAADLTVVGPDGDGDAPLAGRGGAV